MASVMINLAPADTKKSGSVHDMAIFMAILRAMRMISEEPDGCSFIGEISLNGDIRRINGVLPMVMLAREIGIKSVFVPAENAKEASVIDGVDIYAVHNSAARRSFSHALTIYRPRLHTTSPLTFQT